MINFYDKVLEEQIADLNPIQKTQLLDYINLIKDSKSTTNQDFSNFAGVISKEELTMMERSIEENCEQVDINEW